MNTVSADSVAQDQIKAFVERIERLEEERKAIARDIAEVYAEAKGNGFDRKALKDVVRIRSMDATVRMEHDALVGMYLAALGMATYRDFDEDESGTLARARARARAPAHAHVETIEEFDPETGEFKDHPGGENANSVGKADASHASLRSGREEASHLAHNQEIAGSSPAPATTSEVPRHEVEEAGEGEVTPPVSSVPHSEPASPPSEKAEPGDRRAEASPAATVVAGNVMTFRTHNPETHFLNSTGLLRLHGCLKPELCGSSEPRKRLCFDCSRLHDGPVHQDQAEAG